MPAPLDQGSFGVVISFDEFNEFKIKNEDITECYFIENLYNMSMLGRISIHDRYGIREYGPLTGDERIVIQWGIESAVVKEFTIYHIPAVENIVEFQQQQSSIINVFFCDTYYFNLTQKKFSKSWDKDTKWSDVMQDILKNMLRIPADGMNVEQSADKLEKPWYIPNWTPANTLRYIMDRATGTTGKYGYLCFPNSSKLINCVTLENLLKTGQKDPDIYVFNTDDLSYSNKILGWSSIGVNQMGVGEVGGGQCLGFNPNTKSFIGLEPDEEFIYSKAIKEITTLGKQSLFDGDYIDNDSTKFNYQCYLTGEESKEVVKNIWYNNFMRRYSLQNALRIMVPGHEKRVSGSKIDIFWPSMNLDDYYNSNDSGMYLIKSTTHYFCPMVSPMYRQALVLMKNAYNDVKYGDNDPCSGTDLFSWIADMIGWW